jgi:hypothetical protein
MYRLISLVILVLVIVALVDVIQRPMETGKKILWIVLIVLLPLIGTILYFLLGRK